MPSVSAPYQRSRGPMNGWQWAAFWGSTEQLVALLSDGSTGIDDWGPTSHTPLMIASGRGHSHVVRILLNMGANLAMVDCDGFTALHCSAGSGHPTVSSMLVNAGADLEAASITGDTPLYLAADRGHLEVMAVLIEAGAKPDSRTFDGATPLYSAAQSGHVDAIKLLLRAKANPLLTWTYDKSGEGRLPLGVAAQFGHLEVVRELVQQLGIDGCCGASGGIDALRVAAGNQHMEILEFLTDAGVVDDGEALTFGVSYGRELSVKFLLQQRNDDGDTYANHKDFKGTTPMLFALCGVSSPSPRIVRLLVDAGADTTSAFRITNTEGKVICNDTPFSFTSLMLRQKKLDGKDATEEHLHRVEGIRRLLLRVEAAHAVSFLWPVDNPTVVGNTAARGTSRTVAASTPLRMMLPVLRRRARRPGVLLGALFRCSGKP